jgi:SAM-dependent methyltransferase
MSSDTHDLEEEAQAFNARISERVAAGFIPDLRRAVKCDYFYKSFWRDPHFIDLYLGKINREYLELLHKYCGTGKSILDVGCGAGYMSLELARNGYHVDAIDISDRCIEEARAVLASNPYQEGFGSLRYHVMPLQEASGGYDVVLFSVSLHHMTDLDGALLKARELLKPGGHLLCYEPCHDRWQMADAAQVMLIRGLLALTGHWHDRDELPKDLGDEAGLSTLTRDIHEEYFHERDKSEGGQSPHDNESSGAEMLAALRSQFDELETRAGHSFIYRLLGGIRGSDSEISQLADFIAAYDRLAVRDGFMNPNGFYFIGRARE